MKCEPRVCEEYLTSFGRLVLFSYDETSEDGPVKPWENIQMLAKDGHVVWKVNGMEKSRYGWSAASPDTFVMLYSRDGNFYANTFGGHIFKIDIETGKTLYHGFGK